MPSSFVRLADAPRKGKSIKSAFESESFDADVTIHVDGLVGSATISPCGRDVALASPEGLAIIDLDSPWSPPRRLSSHGLPWLVVDVQWSPFAARDYWIASTANHRCLVWNLNKRDDSPSGAIEHSLQAHSRAITDINFSAHHPDSLATCSVDGYVYCWDLRRPRQPALAFCDWFAGATQVKYNRQDPYVLASAHDRWLHIWDTRRAVEPLKTISAHTSKIYGIDWNRTKSTCVVTCSLDKSIKFWDYGQDDETPQRVIRTDFPVWRARHTPFGYGLLAMPQTEPGNLYLYDQRAGPETPVDGAVQPTAVFPGHGSHKAKEFLWRSRGGVSNEGIDNREFQLVSWGEDKELRLHKVEPELLESVGHVRGTPLMENLNVTRRGATYKTFRTVNDAIHRDRRIPTMSDRPGSGGQFRQSALSIGLNSSLRRVGPSWRPTSMKAKTNTSRHVDKTQLQIGWMKGISMSKRKPSSDSPGRVHSSLFSPGFDAGWGEPEAIQDEFLRISNQLPNVKWDNIDMDSLTLNASLKGPWGVNRETIFIKVRVDIPTGYPKTKAPRFYVEKSSFMPEETHRKIELELYELANRFLQRKQNCLYMAFSYLLGETDLESSTAFFENVRDLDDDLDALADESSSEEDENDIPTGGSASMSQELSASTELDPSATLASAQRQAVTPLPVYCGARFSNDGRLVCFFPSKEEKAKALFGLPHPESYRDRPKGEPTFAGFGRLAHDSPPPKHRFHDEISATDDQSGESDSEDSTSSTDSEPTTVHKIDLWYQPGRRFRKSWSANESARSSGGGTGTGAGTGTGTGTSRRRPSKPKNIITIYNLQSEIPSKKQFAQEYAIFGDGADVCSHNAAVAEKYGYQDLVHVWKYAALLLRRDIPLEIHGLQHTGQPVLVIARDAVARANEKVGDDSQATTPGSNLAGRVRWGYHPLARDLINDLFDYYEKIADIQMLAMLACIFGDYSMEEEAAIAASHLPQPKTPLPMKAPSFSLEYFPTDPALWNLNYRSQASSAITTPRTANTPALYSDPPSSDETAGFAEPRSHHSYSCGETPPNASREHLREVSQTQSLSTSPSNRLFHRSNSTVAAAIAASLPRALAGIVSGSPPDPIRKRPSPAEAMLNALTPHALVWAGSSTSGAGPDTPGTSRTSFSDDEPLKDDLMAMVPIAVSCVPENQGLFDDDGWISGPLIDRSRFKLYSNYRYAYAEMLQMWGLPLSRLEIMKFDVLKEDALSPAAASKEGSVPNNTPLYPTGAASPTSPFVDRRSMFHELATSGRGLDVTGFCRVHPGVPLEPVEYLRPTNPNLGYGSNPQVVNGSNGVCHRCSAERDGADLVPQTEMRCVYCWEPVTGLFAPCLSCGCVSHEACLADWHAMGGGECPAGHDCYCLEDASNATPDSWAGLQVAVPIWFHGDVERVGPTGQTSRSGTPTTIASARSARSRRKSAPADAARFHMLRRTHTDSSGTTGTEGYGTEAVPHTRPSTGRNPGGGSSRRHNNSNRGHRHDDDDDDLDHHSHHSHGHSRSHSSHRNRPDRDGGGLLLAGVKPPPRGEEPVSAAQLSLGKRLKKQLEESGRPGVPRRNSGGLAMWKAAGGGG
ncbi:95c0d43c-61ce-40fc-8f06-f91815ad641b [Thermothielavioides terrestris]|uniref:95c0d43c-61ce-40fc-8f06-f91815ad641b n=1 Tax=Thermothielavioides terrestris TaxID=2587410 RepID=A0A446BAQ2_9PEZI|nr:95c0d43c-61ce-40fc-8f06-f91815ad641b [Thermothielavioides terrestris]